MNDKLYVICRNWLLTTMMKLYINNKCHVSHYKFDIIKKIKLTHFLKNSINKIIYNSEMKLKDIIKNKIKKII